MRRLMLVANPSSSGFTGSLFRDVLSTLGRDFAVIPVWPINPAETRERAAEAAAQGIDVVAAMGGDGVVHHAANGLVGTTTALGIIPAGTTNVLARLAGAPRDPRKATAALNGASPLPTRVVRVTSDSGTGARSEYALFSIGVGFDADVVEIAEQRPESKVWLGGLHFARAAAGRVLGPYRRKAPDLTITVDDESIEAIAFFAQVHRLYTYLGRLPIRLASADGSAPAAGAITKLDLFTAVRILARIAARRELSRLSAVRVWPQFDRATVTADTGAPFQADGEHLGHATSIVLDPLDDALLVLR